MNLCFTNSFDVVGVTGFEPATSWSQTRRSTKLSYTPIVARLLSCALALRIQNLSQRR